MSPVPIRLFLLLIVRPTAASLTSGSLGNHES
jgi:hypothetical protein